MDLNQYLLEAAQSIALTNWERRSVIPQILFLVLPLCFADEAYKAVRLDMCF